jgi:hypothetical protein
LADRKAWSGGPRRGDLRRHAHAAQGEFKVVADGGPVADMPPFELTPEEWDRAAYAIGRTVAMVHALIKSMRPQD